MKKSAAAAKPKGKAPPTKAALKSKPKALMDEEKPQGRGRKASAKPKYVDDDEDDEEDDEPPAKKPAPKKSPAAKKSPARGGKKSEAPAATPTKRTPSRNATKVKYTDASDSEDFDDEPVPAKKAKKAGGKRRR